MAKAKQPQAKSNRPTRATRPAALLSTATSTNSTPKKAHHHYTDAQIEKAIRKAGGMVSVAARALGCDTKTIYNRMDAVPAIKRAVDDARDDMLDRAESKLLDQIEDGNITAIICALKTVGKARGYVERQEVTGADGAPLMYSKVSPDDWDKGAGDVSGNA